MHQLDSLHFHGKTAWSGRQRKSLSSSISYHLRWRLFGRWVPPTWAWAGGSIFYTYLGVLRSTRVCESQAADLLPSSFTLQRADAASEPQAWTNGSFQEVTAHLSKWLVRRNKETHKWGKESNLGKKVNGKKNDAVKCAYWPDSRVSPQLTIITPKLSMVIGWRWSYFASSQHLTHVPCTAEQHLKPF